MRIVTKTMRIVMQRMLKTEPICNLLKEWICVVSPTMLIVTGRTLIVLMRMLTMTNPVADETKTVVEATETVVDVTDRPVSSARTVLQ
jgi:hypothetical protein